MPNTKICDQCHNKEYKNVKKKTNRKRSLSAQEVCSESGEGVWIDKNDCTAYYLCRHLGTTWAEEKKELCYPGSYYDQVTKSCKWVGVGNVDCTGLVEPEEKPLKKPKERNSKTTAKLARTKSTPNSEKLRSKTGSAKQSDLNAKILDRAMYTCRADKEPQKNDSEHDYVKCYSCESGSLDLEKCKQANKTNSIVKCLKKQQICYTKIVRDASNHQIELLSRGCVSLDSLDFVNNTNRHESTHTNITHCVSRSKKLRSCYALCDGNLCNNLTNIKENSASSPQLSFYFISLNLLFISKLF